MYPRTRQKELSFRGEKLARGRHKIHPYPAMLHPLLVDFLIDKYAKEGDVIFDPFCGSGVTLVQSGIKGYKSIGIDINPLALLIAKTKTQRYVKKRLLEEFSDLKEATVSSKKIDVPEIKNIDYWYSKKVINDLGRIRFVLKNKDYKYRNFFMTNFAFVCRDQSFTRKGEFKRYRMQEEKVKNMGSQVFEKLFSRTEGMVKIFEATDIPEKSGKPMLANSENGASSKIRYDLVITSPPYGDSRTTVAYGQYTSFGSDWVDDLNVYGGNNYRVDNECLGKAGQIDNDLKDHKPLINTVKKIEKVNAKRANEVFLFFNGYYKAVKSITDSLEKKGKVCFVVGNRTVKGCQIPMDQITASFFESMGLNFKGIFVRDISNKVMPSRNSPSNKVGEKSKTMTNEYIVIFDKE